jgi:hypothetical protein
LLATYTNATGAAVAAIADENGRLAMPIRAMQQRIFMDASNKDLAERMIYIIAMVVCIFVIRVWIKSCHSLTTESSRQFIDQLHHAG